MSIIFRNQIRCQKCKHYESYHQYPNLLCYAEHYCKKCAEEIEIMQNGGVFIPKRCYFNDYFEESAKAKKERLEREKYRDFCQIED